METPWYAHHDNIVTLTRYMAEQGYEARTIAYAVEKPWKYEDIYKEAEEDLKGEEIEE